jgi:hypothetical protein
MAPVAINKFNPLAHVTLLRLFVVPLLLEVQVTPSVDVTTVPTDPTATNSGLDELYASE